MKVLVAECIMQPTARNYYYEFPFAIGGIFHSYLADELKDFRNGLEIRAWNHLDVTLSCTLAKSRLDDNSITITQYY